ncbi:hypothetical protein DFP72DRAFT_591845, partial [Ephemerocybe angulata]
LTSRLAPGCNLPALSFPPTSSALLLLLSLRPTDLRSISRKGCAAKRCIYRQERVTEDSCQQYRRCESAMDSLENGATITSCSSSNLSNPLQVEGDGIDDIEEFHHRVDSRIHDLECETLKTRRNAATFTCRLPAELLSKIFLALSHMSSQNIRDPVHKRVDWLICTFVCRRWRDVALGCTELWTTPIFAKPALAETMLARSKDAPLKIRFNGKAEEPSGALFKALSQLNRLRSVELMEVTEGNSQFQEMLSSWTGQAPLLTTLHLAKALAAHAATQGNYTFPIGFLQGGTPSLKSLVLSCWGTTWDNLPIGPNITNLVMIGSPANPPRRPTQAAFVSCLKRLPFLESLTFINQMLPGREDAVVLPPNNLHPPKLRYLTVGDPVWNIYFLLRLLQVPRETKLALVFCGSDNLDMLEEIIDNAGVFATKGGSTFHNSQESIRHMSVRGSPAPRCPRVCLWSQGHRPDFDALPDHCFDFRLGSDGPDQPVFRLLNYLVLDSLHSLHVNAFHLMSKSQWRSTLGQLPNLETVFLDQGPLQEWLEILRYDPPSESQDNWAENGERHFPGLIRMAFRAMDLGKEKAETLRLLVQVLKERTTTSPSFKMDVLFYKCPDPNNNYEKMKQATEGLNVNWSFFP